LVDRRGDEDMGFLNAAVDDADGRRVSLRRYGRYVGNACGGRPGRLLRQGNVFRFNDLENVRIIEDDVLQPFPGDFETGGKTIGKNG
jgi:hypothetical protein